MEAVSGYAISQDGGLVVALDTNLTPELVAEGRAREVVHRVQTMRKDAGLNVEDRIELEFAGDADLERVLADFGDYVRRETLAVSLERCDAPDGHAWSGQIDHLSLRLAIRPAKG
jgi:isoleucyl-tRNA synthetase